MGSPGRRCLSFRQPVGFSPSFPSSLPTPPPPFSLCWNSALMPLLPVHAIANLSRKPTTGARLLCNERSGHGYVQYWYKSCMRQAGRTAQRVCMVLLLSDRPRVRSWLTAGIGNAWVCLGPWVSLPSLLGMLGRLGMMLGAAGKDGSGRRRQGASLY